MSDNQIYYLNNALSELIHYKSSNHINTKVELICQSEMQRQSINPIN